jgi:hypothetical protein
VDEAPEDLRHQVRDLPTFRRFVEALAAERSEAQELEADASNYKLGGAHGWQNGDIASYLYACLDYFSTKPFHQPEAEPSWRMFADFLYFGKIIE